MAIGMTMKVAILADTTLAALVGTRVHPLVFPYKVTFPCITYRVISGALVPNVGGDDYISRLQYDIWSREYDDTNEIKDAMFSLFNLMGGNIGGQEVISTAIDLTFDTFEQATKLYRAVIDVRVRHEGS